MKRYHNHRPNRKWVIPFTLFSIFFLIFILIVTLSHIKSSSSSNFSYGESKYIVSDRNLGYVNGGLGFQKLSRFAYLISGTKGDGKAFQRLLQAVYHPRNYYLLHLDLEASNSERFDLAKYVKSASVIRQYRNVMVVGKADLITHKGPTMIASTLHSIAILLKRAKDWDWFINLDVSDYPLISQDDLLHVFSYLPKGLNFIEHTSNLGWKEFNRAMPIIIDPALYHSKKSGVFWAKERRLIPSPFKLFTGSPWVVLSKSFVEFCIWGWDSLPRTILMYYTNFLSSSEGYFHTVVCNHKDYQNTTVNHDLRYTKWENLPKYQMLNLTLEHWDDMVGSGAPFAQKFVVDDPVLDKIDEELLGRSEGRFTPGGWCVGNRVSDEDQCVVYENPNVIRPTVASKRLEKFLIELLDDEHFRPRQCK